MWALGAREEGASEGERECSAGRDTLEGTRQRAGVRPSTRGHEHCCEACGAEQREERKDGVRGKKTKEGL